MFALCVCACNILKIQNRANNFNLILNIKALLNHVSLWQPNRWPWQPKERDILACCLSFCIHPRKLFFLLKTIRQLFFSCLFFISKLLSHYILSPPFRIATDVGILAFLLFLCSLTTCFYVSHTAEVILFMFRRHSIALISINENNPLLL